jgi:RNA polymerase sigma factor (TIGR02999 family)
MSHPADNTASTPRSVFDEQLYHSLREAAERVCANERSGHTLQPTAVVNEACIRIMASGLPDLPHEQRLAIAGRVLRQVLVDHARARNALKRGGGAVRLNLEHEPLSPHQTLVEFDRVHLAIDRLARASPRQAEIVTLRIFSGLTVEQIAGVLGVSKRTVEGDWTVARAWLRRELDSPGAADAAHE